jgi:hypothetical protein
MKALAVIGLSLALGLGGVAGAQASSGHHHPVAKKKCKHGWTPRKGKCRRVKAPPLPPQAPPSPSSIVRATLTWDGPARLWMQVTGQQGRAGYFPGEGLLNEIPNAHYEGGMGESGPRTETFTDDLFYGGYGFTYYPSPGNRGFGFTECYGGTSGTDPSHVSFTWVGATGLVSHDSWTITPPAGPETTGCATVIN